MVRECQRLMSCRGTSRGWTSRCSAEAEIRPPCHCPHCHCFCYYPRSKSANPIRPSQFMEASSPGTSSAPFFGSAIFSFDSPLNHPCINAHIFVLFIDEAVDKGSSSAPPNFVPLSDEAREAELHQADKGKGLEMADPQLEKSQQQLEAVVVTEGKVQDEEEYGPCPIVEEEPEE